MKSSINYNIREKIKPEEIQYRFLIPEITKKSRLDISHAVRIFPLTRSCGNAQQEISQYRKYRDNAIWIRNEAISISSSTISYPTFSTLFHLIIEAPSGRLCGSIQKILDGILQFLQATCGGGVRITRTHSFFRSEDSEDGQKGKKEERNRLIFQCVRGVP